MGNAIDQRAVLTESGTNDTGAPRHPVRLVAIAAIATLALLVVGESMWWNIAPKSCYPAFFVSAAPSHAKNLLDLRDACGDSIQVAPAGDGEALVRCGTWWPARTVWRVPRSYVRQVLPG
ncbi:hypothetical protein SNE35_24270 [Paucibacter sp. R3-3]|uniref:Uncharacterized protein n=1 Tax=Roseateles agri TaxID=3098619 RepID=A0ABU5DMU2_9BURK|nr:hypothetical protein [Paucibacter sp. R3-3]MDY0747640.1 hypothetical protein [Paucibacter sp. R3-3]